MRSGKGFAVVAITALSAAIMTCADDCPLSAGVHDAELWESGALQEKIVERGINHLLKKL
jgi:hypothetical protein